MTSPQSVNRRVPLLLVGSFAFAFLGPAVVQVFLRNLLPPAWSHLKVTSILAVLYCSFMVWRPAVTITQRLLGDKWSFLLGMATYLLIPGALVFTDNYCLLAILAAAWGWGAASIWQTGPVWLYDTTDAGRRGFWAGLLYAWVFAGLFAGTLLVGQAAKAYGRNAMLTLMIIPGLIAVLFAAALPARPSRAAAFSISGVRSMLLDGRVTTVGILLFLSSTSYGLLLGAFRDKIDLYWGPSAVGGVVASFYLTRLVISLLGGHFSDIFARRSVVASAFLLGGAGLAVGSAFHGVPSLYFASVCLGIVGAVVPVSATAYCADWFPVEKRSLALGIAFLWGDAATTLSLLAGQYISDAAGSFNASLRVFAALFLLGAFLPALAAGNKSERKLGRPSE